MKLSITMVTLGLRFNGDSLETMGLGGSETAFIQAAKALASHGHDVRCYCDCDRPGIYDEVHFNNISQFQSQVASVPPDILIVSRWPEFLSMPNNAGLRVLWLHDMPSDENRLMSNLFQTDIVMGLSNFHIAEYLEKTPELRDYFFQTRNGVDLDLINKNLLKIKVPGKMVYTSRPERGLHHFLKDIFPRILKERPDAKLYFCNYSIADLQVGDNIKQVNEFCLMEASKYPENVINLGHLPKAELYKHISSAEVLVYPTGFPEISCITVLEAQACGTPVVTTSNFALVESVGLLSGYLVSGSPLEERYQEEFAQATLNVLNKKTTFDPVRHINSLGYNWKAITAGWLNKFINFMENRWDSQKPKIFDKLVWNNDVFAAQLLGGSVEAIYGNTLGSLGSDYTLTTEMIKDAWQEAMPRFMKLCELLKLNKTIPKKFLEIGATDVSFGLYLAKALPSCSIVISPYHQDMVPRIRKYADDNDLNVTVIESLNDVGDEKYDTVFLNQILEQQDAPHETIEYYAAELLEENGIMLFDSNVGPTQPRVDKFACTRFWDLSYFDFRDLLGESASFFCVFEQTQLMMNHVTGHWLVAAKKPRGKKIDLKRRKLTTRPYQTLALCMIVKDEEDWISGCLRSIRKYVDEAIVVDTGSGDTTVRIAEKFDVEVRRVEFDNFGEARNRSKRGVETDWILWLDADERVVEGNRLGKYLDGIIFNGFAIKQNHIMLDLHGTFDTPVRMFRNLEHYQFTGYIHEHCEDVSKNPFNDAIGPTMIIPDVDIAHYGYLNEKVRRDKCSNRNMQLLQRDIEDNGKRGRLLTWILVIRDYLNIVKWRLLASGQPIIPGSEEHSLVVAAIELYLEHFSDKKTKHYQHVFPLYQEALKYLGLSNIAFTDRKAAPFEIGLALSGGLGGLDEKSKQVKMSCVWFLDDDEYLHFTKEKAADLVVRMGIANREKYQDELETPLNVLYSKVNDPAALLDHGMGIIPRA